MTDAQVKLLFAALSNASLHVPVGSLAAKQVSMALAIVKPLVKL